jgi:hypothetical protein
MIPQVLDSLHVGRRSGQVACSAAEAKENIVLKNALKAASFIGALALGQGTADASLIMRTFTFTGSDFIDLLKSNTAPTSPVIGSVTVTFDPTVPETDDTTGVVLNSLNVALTSPISFDYFNATDQIIFGGLQFGAAVEGTGFDDFSVVFNAASAATPTFKSLLYRVSGPLSGSAFQAESGSVSATAPISVTPPPPPPEVPEPGTLAVLTFGLGALAMVRRRERTATPIA